MSDAAVMTMHHADGRTTTVDPGALARERVELEREAVAIARANAPAIAAIPQALHALASAVAATVAKSDETALVAKALAEVTRGVAALQADERARAARLEQQVAAALAAAVAARDEARALRAVTPRAPTMAPTFVEANRIGKREWRDTRWDHLHEGRTS